MASILEQLKTVIPDVVVEEGELLAAFTAIKIGGPARYFLRARSLEVLKTAVLEARKIAIPTVVFGAGSGVLVADNGFDGLVIKTEDRHWETDGEIVRSGSGIPLVFLAREAAKAGNTGFEFMAAVPGTVGGAIRGNAGIGARSIGESIVRVRILDEQGKDRWLLKEECRFGYRSSVFQRHRDWVILEGEFFMEFGNKEISEAKVIEILQKKAAVPSLGLPAVYAFRDVDRDGSMIAPGELIKEVGLETAVVGGAAVSTDDPSYLVNTGGATADQMIQLMSLLKTRVRDSLGVQLVDAVELVGF